MAEPAGQYIMIAFPQEAKNQGREKGCKCPHKGMIKKMHYCKDCRCEDIGQGKVMVLMTYILA
jgi:hypothetical protein